VPGPTAGPCLVLRALGLGDLLTGVPALRALRRGLAGELVLAAPEPLRPLVELAGVADRLLPTAGLGPLGWTGPPPALAVDLHGNGPASKAPLLGTRARRVVAFAGPGPDGTLLPGPAWDPEEHEVRRWCRLVEEGLGLPADPADLLITLPEPPPESPPELRPAPVIVHPGAASGSRRWPPDRFAEVARWASGLGPVLVTGTAEERDLADDVGRRAGLPLSSVLAGRTDLAGLVALVGSARLVVCGDTGVAHVASALRTPSVVLFGPIPPRLWGPPGSGPHVALWADDPASTRRGDPHGARPDERLLAISVADVVEAALSLLPGTTAPAGRPPRPAS